MHTIDRNALEDAIGAAFKALKSGIDTHSQQSIEMYSAGLRALLELRKQVLAEESIAS